MSKFMILMALLLATAVFGASPALAHNAGCVTLPDGSGVFVGSNKDAPLVNAHAPSQFVAAEGGYVLDLIPGSGDQYGARFAADQGASAVTRPTTCTAEGPRSGF